jgi:hypothetical protein
MNGRMSKTVMLVLAALVAANRGAAADLTIAGAAATPWIVKVEGQLLVETLLSIKNSGKPVKLWARIGVPGKPARIEPLGEVAAGANSLTVRHAELAADGEKIEFSVFDNEKCAGQPLATAVFPLDKSRHWTIYVNHDMHLDVGYTAYQEDLKLKIWPKYLDTTLQQIADSADWDAPSRARQGIESSMLLYDAALLARDADWVETLKGAIRDRRIGYSATFGNIAQENMSAELLVRSCYYSGRHLHDMLGGGCAPVANMADNNSISASIIDVFHAAGIRYYTLRLWGAESRWRAPAALFYLEARPSGKRLLVCDYGNYTKEPFNLRSGKVEAVRDAVAKRLLELQKDPRYPYDAVLCQFTNGDNGPPSSQVYRVIREFNALGYEYPKLVCALPEDFYRHVESRFAARIPVAHGTFENWWNYGVGSTAYETAAYRGALDTLAAAEMLSTFNSAAKSSPYPYEAFSTAWKNLLLYAEHTWGSSGSGVDNQWFWKRNTALGPEVVAEGLLRRALTEASARISTDGPAVAVWNFASFSRTDRVEAELPDDAHLVDGADGGPVAVERVAPGRVAFVARDVPGLGYRLYRIAPKAAPAPPADELRAGADSLENRFFRVVFDPKGNVRSIIDKRHGDRELVDAACGHRLNQFLYWLDGQGPATPEKVKLTSAAGPVMATMTAEGACAGVESMKRTVILYRDLDRIDIVNDLVKSPSGFGRGKAWPKEEGYFAFPLNMPGFLLRHEMPIGNVRPLVDPNPGEPEQLPTTCTDHYTVNRWVHVSDQKGYGATLACVDAPLVMYGERRARKFDVAYKAKTPWIYSYVFNNLWYTNFQKTQPGRLVLRYSLRPSAGADWREAGAPRLGVAASSPLRAVTIAQKQAGDRLPSACSLLAIDQPNVLLIAAKLAEANGEGTILRLNEIEGRDTKVVLDLARWTPKAVTATDPVENDLGPVAMMGTKVSLTVPAFGTVTLRLVFGDPPPAIPAVDARTDTHGTLVKWQPVAGAVLYEVFRGGSGDFTPGAGNYVATTSAARLLDRQVHAGVKGKYFYKVRAAGPGRKGPFSPAAEAAIAAIDDTQPPSAPLLSAKALRFDKVALSWATPDDDVAVKGYKLFRDGQPLADVPAVYNTWLDLRTDPDKQYEYTIYAYDDAGNLSPPSTARVETKGFVVPAGTLPAEPLPPLRKTAAPAEKPQPTGPPKPKPGNVAPQATVTVSSEFSADYAGKHLTDGICGEHENGEWASKGESKPWVRFEWKEPVAIGKVVIYDRPNSSDHATAGRLIFSEGESVSIADIPNDGAPRIVNLGIRKVTWLRFEVTESSGRNIGLSEVEIFRVE